MKDILPELNGKDYIEALPESYDIHFCRNDEVDDLVAFLDTYWRKNHIFVLSRQLLDWQHYDRVNDRYNFVLARNRASGEIHSILGFVPTYQFAPEIRAVEIWPCIWKSRDDVHVKGLGVALYHYLKVNIPIETISILGISAIALSIYKHWNFQTGTIEHYYYPNMQASEALSAGREAVDAVTENLPGWTLRPISLNEYSAIDGNDALFASVSRYKSKAFYINRYFRHPMYTYQFLAVSDPERIRAILVVRECAAEAGKCLRVIDYLGPVAVLKNVRHGIQRLLAENGYEYMDFMQVGISDTVMKEIGFLNRKDNPNTVIPNYFEPFAKENIDLDYAFKTVDPTAPCLFYKGDADQDRPNMLP